MKIGLPGAVFLVFLIMKLTHHIEWSWIWVTAPLWGVLGIAGAVMLFALLMALAVKIIEATERRRRRR